jgi:hypothetical protein
LLTFCNGDINSVGISIKGEPNTLCVFILPDRISTSSGNI